MVNTFFLKIQHEKVTENVTINRPFPLTLCEVMDVKYCGYHFTTYVCIESLCCTP